MLYFFDGRSRDFPREGRGGPLGTLARAHARYSVPRGTLARCPCKGAQDSTRGFHFPSRASLSFHGARRAPLKKRAFPRESGISGPRFFQGRSSRYARVSFQGSQCCGTHSREVTRSVMYLTHATCPGVIISWSGSWFILVHVIQFITWHSCSRIHARE